MGMKKRFILSICILIPCLILGIMTYQEPNDKRWFTLENIIYDTELNMIEGYCIDKVYTGDMQVYLPDNMDTSHIKNHQTIQVYGGPGMTMSIPAQLMNCTKIKILD